MNKELIAAAQAAIYSENFVGFNKSYKGIHALIFKFTFEGKLYLVKQFRNKTASIYDAAENPAYSASLENFYTDKYFNESIIYNNSSDTPFIDEMYWSGEIEQPN